MYKAVTSDPNWLTYASPFTKEFLIVTGSVLLLCGFLFGVTLRFGDDVEATSEAMMLVHGCLNQGTPYDPQKHSTRIVFLTIFITATVLWCSYSAILTSFLTAKVDFPPFQNLEQMFHGTNYRIVTIGGGIYETIFMVHILHKRQAIQANLCPEMKAISDCVF